MSWVRIAALLRAWYALIRFDLHKALRIETPLDRLPAVARSPRCGVDVAAIVDGFELATCLYWKPVRCLERSVCLVRLLRSRGVAATVVIGYRPLPFVAHAWVEVDGHILNDSSAYQQRLKRLLVV